MGKTQIEEEINILEKNKPKESLRKRCEIARK